MLQFSWEKIDVYTTGVMYRSMQTINYYILGLLERLLKHVCFEFDFRTSPAFFSSVSESQVMFKISLIGCCFQYWGIIISDNNIYIYCLFILGAHGYSVYQLIWIYKMLLWIWCLNDIETLLCYEWNHNALDLEVAWNMII